MEEKPEDQAALTLGEDLLAQIPEEERALLREAFEDGATCIGEAMGLSAAHRDRIEFIGQNFYQAYRYDEAMGIYQWLTFLEPFRATAWRGLGACHQATKNYLGAAFCYQQAAQIDPQDVATQVFWAECLIYLDRRDRATEMLERLLQNSDRDPEPPTTRAYLKRAQALLRADSADLVPILRIEKGRKLPYQPRETEEEGSTSKNDSASDPQKTDPWHSPEVNQAVEKIAEHMKLGELTLRDVGGFTDRQIDGAYASACEHVRAGRLQEGLMVAGQVLMVDPREAKTLQLAGIIMQRLKRYDLAEFYYELALTFDPQNPRSLIYRGETQILAGQAQSGQKLLRQGLALARDNPALLRLAQRAQTLLKRYGGPDAPPNALKYKEKK